MSFLNTTAWVSSGGWPVATQQQPVRPMVTLTPTTYQPVRTQTPGYNPLPGLTTAPAHDGFFAPVPSYPASNMPEMWRRMHPYIAHSPTLRQQLPHLAQSGWNVYWNQRQGSQCDMQGRQISIDIANPETLVMQLLAHETSHAFDPVVAPHQHATDTAYAHARLRNEAVAVVNHLRVRSEIFQGCGQDIGMAQRDPGYYENAVAFRQLHGSDERLLQHIQRLMAWDITSIHGRCYWEAFLNEWRSTRGWPPVSVTPDMIEAQRGQAWHALAGEMNAR